MSYFPAGNSPDSCKEIESHNNPDLSPEAELQIDAAILFLNLCNAVGLPSKAFGFSGAQKGDKEESSLTRLLRLGTRAQAVTSQRGPQ